MLQSSMIVSIFGGGIEGQIPELLSMMLQEIQYAHPKQVLLLPFARQEYKENSEWNQYWYRNYFRNKDTTIEFLDASVPEQLDRAVSPMIFISGGKHKKLLKDAIDSNSKMKELIYSASNIIVESGCSMLLGMMSRLQEPGAGFMEGLNILSNTIVESHYFEQNRRDVLLSEMKQFGAKYGIGVDSNSGVRIDTEKPYDNCVPLGNKKWELIVT